MRHWYAGLSLRTKITGITVLITILSLAAVATIGIFEIGRRSVQSSIAPPTLLPLALHALRNWR